MLKIDVDSIDIAILRAIMDAGYRPKFVGSIFSRVVGTTTTWSWRVHNLTRAVGYNNYNID